MDSASFQYVQCGLAAALPSNFNRSRAWRSIPLLLASVVLFGIPERNPIVFLRSIGLLLLGYAGLILIERGFGAVKERGRLIE